MTHCCPIPVADRAQALREGVSVPDPGVALAPAAAAALRDALRGGETHYTPRPGIPELQAEVGRRLVARGAPTGGSVVVTSGRQEALFVALAGLRQRAGEDSGAGSVLLTPGAAADAGTFEAAAALELTPAPVVGSLVASGTMAVAVVTTAGELSRGVRGDLPRPDEVPWIVDCGRELAAPEGAAFSGVPPEAVLIGSLHGADGLASFRVGFFRAPEAVLGRLRTLKQAISICTAAPSQRAAALVLGAPAEPAPADSEAEAAAESRGPRHRPGARFRDDSRYSLMELAARLDGVISLGRGDPDADAPAPVIEAACDRLGETEPLDPRGQPWLRQRIAAHEEARTGTRFDPETEVLVTGGAQEGITLAMLALVGEREEVLLGDPRYTSYQQAIALARGRMALVPCGTEGGDFGLRARDAEEALARCQRPRLLAIVNFSNPTGARTTEEEVHALSGLAERHHLWVVADEVYAAMAFDGAGPVLSPVSLPGMKNRTLTLGSVSKSYAMTGFRIGWIIGPADAIAACARLKAAISGPTSLFCQRAAAAALDGGDAFPARLRDIYAPRRRLLMEGLPRLGIPVARHGGGFFLWADISRFGLPAEAFCRRLLLDARVLMFPGNAFGSRWTRYARVSMLQSEPQITEALTRLRHFHA